MRAWIRGLAVSCALFVSVGCGTQVYRPSSAAGFVLDPAYEISDSDIKRAFAAKPQLRVPVQVAYFSFDASKNKAIENALRKSQNVRGTYAIPSFLVTGKRRYDRVLPSHLHGRNKKAPSIKKMRLMAARAHCDVLIIFDYAFRVETTANWTVAFVVPLVTALFLPFLDEKVESYLEAYVLDVRNGYLYGHVSVDTSSEKRYRTIYSQWAAQQKKSQWEEVLKKTKRELTKLMASSARESTRSRAATRAASSQPATKPAP
jgi:predicted RNA-binding protein with PIN domain